MAMKIRSQLLRFLLGLAFISGWLVLFGNFQNPLIPSRVETLQPANIASNGGNSYSARPTAAWSIWPLVEVGVDSAGNPRASNLKILENGVELGPAHSTHSEIVRVGRGQFSYWKSNESVLLFSTSDNTDPRTNGRTYTVVAEPRVTSLLFVLVLLPLSAVLLQWFWSRWLGGAVLVMAATAFAAWLWLYLGRLSLAPDSTTYAEWLPLVPLGYPLFLGGVKALFGSLVWTSAVQVSILIAAGTFLALAVGKLTGHRAAACATMLLLICYVPMFTLAGFMLSEGLFIPLVLIHVGSAIYLIAEPRTRYAVLLAATAALIMFVRPAGNFAPAAVIFLTLAYKSRFRWMLTRAIVPMIAFMLATFLVNVAVRGNTSPVQVGRVLFPHIAFLFEPDPITGPDQQYAPIIDEALKPYRDAYRAAPNLTERVRYSMNNYNTRAGAVDFAVRTRFAAERGGGALGDFMTDFRQLDSLYVRLSLRTIHHNPVGYFSLVGEQIVGAWKLSVFMDTGAFAQYYVSEATVRYNGSLAAAKAANLTFPEDALRPNLAALENFPGLFIRFQDRINERLFTQKWLIYAIGIVTLIALPVSLFAARGSLHWLALGYCGAIIHGSIVLGAVVTVSIPRYAVPIDPIILAAGAITLDGILSYGPAAIKQLMDRSAWAAVLRRGRTGSA